MTSSIFDRAPGDLSDREITVGLAELGRAIAWHRDQQQHETANRLTEMAAVLADERDRRAALYRDAVDATVPPARQLQPPGLRRARRRHG